MRRRLLVLAVALVGVVLVALAVPLITTYAEDRTQDQYVRRLAHLNRFAVLAQASLEAGEAEALDTDLDRYAEVFGGSVAVVNANRLVVAASGDTETLDPALDPVVDDALVGRASTPPPTAWPWSPGSMTLGSPVGRDAEVVGAVVLVAPTAPVQQAVGGWLLWLAAGGVAVLGLTVFGVVVPFVGWVMRPVHDLDAAAKRLATGDLDSRAHEIGPPELRELAHSFNSMADSVQTSQRQQRDLVADAAHQLGNPLTALRLRIENLATPDRDGIGAALEEADRLDSLVHALLDLSRVGADAVTPEPVDVVAEVRRRCDLWAPVFPALVVRAPDRLEALATDGLVDLVLDALLDNAAKFAPSSEVVVEVTQDAGEVVLSVRDHGPGLPLDDVAKVGDRFFRGREHQNVPGTGLGLAIVRARTADVGGRLTVERATGGGMVVSVGLRPASPGSSAAPPGGAGQAR